MTSNETGGGAIATTTVNTSTWGLYVYLTPSGKLSVVDASGNEVAAPPVITVIGGGDFGILTESGNAMTGPGGEPIKVPVYSPPIYNVFAYTASDGTVTIVDPSGKPVPTPPDLKLLDGQVQVVKDAGGPVAIPPYAPPTTNVYLYTASDGTTTVVDAVGNPISSPPLFDTKGNIVGVNGKPVLDPTTGTPVALPAFTPPTTNVYLYSESIVVDAAGNPVPSPPHWSNSNAGPVIIGPDNKPVLGSDGNPIPIPDFDSNTTPRLLVYLAPDGSPQVVDGAGKPVISPPAVALDPKSGGPVVVDATGQVVLDSSGNPTSLPLYSPPTQGIYAHVVTHPVTGEMDVQIVDAGGNLVPSPPGYLVKQLDPEDPLTIVLTGADGKPLLDEDGNPISVPLHPSSATPPGASPPADEDADVEDLPGEVEGEAEEADEAAGGGETEERGVPEQAEVAPEKEVGAGAAEPPVEGRTSEAAQVDQLSTEPTEDLVAAGLDSPVVDAVAEEAEGSTSETGEGPTSRIGESQVEGLEKIGEETAGRIEATDEVAAIPTMPDVSTEEMVPVDPLTEVGPVGLGDEALVEMMAGREALTGEPAARLGELVEPSTTGGRVVDIPDVPLPGEAPELLEVESKAIPDGQPSDEVSATPITLPDPPTPPTDEVSATPITLPDPPGAIEAMEEAGPVGLGADDLVEMVTGREDAAGEEAVGSREPVEPSVGEEPILEIPEAPLLGEPVELPEIEAENVPDLEPEVVELKVEMAPEEADAAEFRIEVSEAGTLEMDEDTARGLSRIAEEPEDEAVGGLGVLEGEEEDEIVQP